MLGNNPYDENSSEGVLKCYKAYTPKISKEISHFFLSHIPKENIIEIITESAPREWMANGFYEDVIREILIKNVFGNQSIVRIFNL